MFSYSQYTTVQKFISNHINGDFPKICIVMGTGLSSITEQIMDKQEISYNDIPHFPKSTVKSHQGKLVVGKLNGVEVTVLAGRWHYYEGYSTKEITFPIRVMKLLGVEKMIFTNVTGGVNANYNAGDLVIVKDHINMIPENPLRGNNDERFGVRFPDMMKAYNVELRKTIGKVLEQKQIPVKEGVYYALQGPSLETPAEYRMIHFLGADMVGMSTVPEVIVAHHCGIQLATISIVSNVCYPLDRLTETTIDEVIETANKASNKLNEVLEQVVVEL